MPQPQLQSAIDVLGHILGLELLDVAADVVAVEDALLRDAAPYTCMGVWWGVGVGGARMGF